MDNLPGTTDAAEVLRKREMKRARDRRHYKNKKKKKSINEIVFHTKWV